ncbi:MAG: amidohydrolase family protein [SAR202 cluster bacterium]|jgi:hypothetical protein|nr:amidohydrolase family protein [SAR202 cluster bacterium]
METPVIDFHAHIGNWGRHRVNGNIERYIEIMDHAGIDMACINCIFLGDARIANDRVAEIVAKNPARFVPAAFVTPHYPDEAISELERAFYQLGMKYLKIYPDYYQKPNDHPDYFPIYEWLNEHKIPVMSHATYPFDGPDITVTERFRNLSVRYPDIPWILAHAGSSGPGQLAKEIREIRNIYLETCGSGAVKEAIENSVELVGSDRVLFGTDMPLLDARHQIGKVITADISDNDKRKILGGNTIKLLNISTNHTN